MAVLESNRDERPRSFGDLATMYDEVTGMHYLQTVSSDENGQAAAGASAQQLASLFSEVLDELREIKLHLQAGSDLEIAGGDAHD